MQQPTSAPPILAVVIPAFRGRFLANTLESLAKQSVPRDQFRVYVADDGSPEELEKVVAPFAGRLDLTYRRFPENLGRVSLVGHWHRAINDSSEPWVWLFSDDDELEPDSIGAVIETINGALPSTPLVRLALQLIDGEGRSNRPRITYPTRQTHEAFLNDHVTDPNLYCVIQNFVFSRQSYVATGGFNEHPGGHYTDLSSWPRFARSAGVISPPRGGVRYRVHAMALSQQALSGGRGWDDYLTGMVGFFAAMEAEYRAAGRKAHSPCPGLNFAAHILRYQVGRLAWKQMRGVERGALEVWPEMPLATRLTLWRELLAPWVKHFRYHFLHPFRA